MGVPGSGFPAWLRKGKALGGALVPPRVGLVGVSNGFLSLGVCEELRLRVWFLGLVELAFAFAAGAMNSAVFDLRREGLTGALTAELATLGLPPLVERVKACCSRSVLSRSESLATSLLSAIWEDEFQLFLSELALESLRVPPRKNGRGGARGSCASSE